MGPATVSTSDKIDDQSTACSNDERQRKEKMEKIMKGKGKKKMTIDAVRGGIYWYSFQAMWTTHCTCFYCRKNMHITIQPYTCTMALQFKGLRTPPATATATGTTTVTLPMHKIIRGVIIRR